MQNADHRIPLHWVPPQQLRDLVRGRVALKQAADVTVALRAVLRLDVAFTLGSGVLAHKFYAHEATVT